MDARIMEIKAALDCYNYDPSVAEIEFLLSVIDLLNKQLAVALKQEWIDEMVAGVPTV
jgi:predicted acetyltransferase